MLRLDAEVLARARDALGALDVGAYVEGLLMRDLERRGVLRSFSHHAEALALAWILQQATGALQDEGRDEATRHLQELLRLRDENPAAYVLFVHEAGRRAARESRVLRRS